MFLGPAFDPAFATWIARHLPVAAGAATVGAALLQWHRSRQHAAAQHGAEVALRQELLAYLLFNASPRSMPASEFACQVSHLVATRSSFHRAALLLRDSTGTLTVAGSTGFDDLSVEAVNRWGSSVSYPEGSAPRIAGRRVAAFSFTLRLDRRHTEQSPLSSMSCREVHIVPLRAAEGLLGALVVCTRQRSASLPVSSSTSGPAQTGSPGNAASLPLSDLLEPLEALASRLVMLLAAPESSPVALPPRAASRPASRLFRHPAKPSLQSAR